MVFICNDQAGHLGRCGIRHNVSFYGGIISLICIAALLSGCGSPLSGKMREQYLQSLSTASVVMPNGEIHPCYLADTAFRRKRGLMGQRTSNNSVMLFVFENVSRHSFWMKDVFVPLALAFLDDWGRVVEIMEMSPDGSGRMADLPEYFPVEPVRFVLEASPQLFVEKGVCEGAVVGLPARLLSEGGGRAERYLDGR